MQQMRIRAQGVYENDVAFLHRPASAQGRFVSPSARAAFQAPPGFDNQPVSSPAIHTEGLDPAMAQALEALSAAGNLTPQQIQQIQMQLRINTPQAAHGMRTQPTNQL